MDISDYNIFLDIDLYLKKSTNGNEIGLIPFINTFVTYITNQHIIIL